MKLYAKDPAENIVLEFDFTGELTSISTATVSITAQDGSNTAATMLDGAPQITGAKVLQRIKNGVDQIDYKPRCVAISGADVRVRAATLPVKLAC